MYKGLLIYQKEDYNKNKWFADQFIQKGEQFNLDIQLVFTEDLSLMIEEGKLSVYKRERMMISPDFVINRSRNSQISLHFELMGCRVFNNSQVTEICNDKAKTHQIINSHGIKSVKTVISFTGTQSVLTYPVVLKTNRGHGGTEVYKVNNQTELTEYRGQLQPDEIILQEMCNNPGIDVRVFILGGEIIGAVKRYSSNNFRSNFSLGGRAERYNLSFDQRALVNKIGKILDFDFVGIDFLIDHDGEFLFNEIEDAVGTRTLYQQYDYDVVHMYLEYIAKQMMN
jgi:gamma-F420-2:alpha-L-glutamate ligase